MKIIFNDEMKCRDSIMAYFLAIVMAMLGAIFCEADDFSTAIISMTYFILLTLMFCGCFYKED